MRLSANFTLEEMCRSQTAARMGKLIEPTDEQIYALQYHCLMVQQPIRELLGCPIIVTSGLRPEWLNRAIGGSKNSQHIKGEATDNVLVGYKGTLLDACKEIVKSDIKYDQLIYEFGEWIHISSSPNPRGEILSAYSSGGLMPKTIYEQGLKEPTSE